MFRFLSRLFRRRKMPDPVALIALELDVRRLSRGHVAHAVSQAIGRPFPEEDVQEERPSYHRFWVEGFEFTVAASDRRYLEEGPPDLRLQDIVARHRAAVLIDCWSAPEGVEREASTDLMGRILVELMDDATVGVCAFHTGRINAADEELRAMFREGRALEAMSKMTTVPIAGVAADDAAMVAAIAEAKARWPEFAQAFASAANPGDDFVVKAPFGEADRIEHLWLTVAEIRDGTIVGTIQNDAFALPRPRRGETVTIATDAISDWAYFQGGEAVGLFSAKALQGK